MVYDEVSDKSREILVKIRYGGIRRLIPATVAYEFTVRWLEGRIPGLRDIDEVVTFLKVYFQVISISLNDYIKEAEIKVNGDKMLKETKDPLLRGES